jgi:acyl-CoA thioester hydrolase
MHYDIDIHVRYAETDQMGVVYHSNYFPWFEEARTGFFDTMGVSYANLEEQGLLFPLTECGCKYRYPARYADWVTVRARLSEFKGVQAVLTYQVLRKSDGKLLAEGFTKHAFVDREFHPVNLKRVRPDVYNAMLSCVDNGII